MWSGVSSDWQRKLNCGRRAAWTANENVRLAKDQILRNYPAEAGLSEVAVQFVVTSTLDRRENS